MKACLKNSVVIVATLLMSAVSFAGPKPPSQKPMQDRNTDHKVEIEAKKEKATLHAFSQRYEIVRNEKGEVEQIRLRKKLKNFSLKTMIGEIKKDVLAHQERAHNFVGVDALTEAFGVEELQTWKAEDRENSSLSLGEVEHIEIEKILSQKKFKSFIQKYEAKLKKSFIGASVMADLNDPTFFYKRAVGFKVANWGIKLAQRFFDNVPVLNVASFIVKQAEQSIRERRTFHQNGILHYLENFSADELGMSEDEKSKALSSIYESKIAWMAFWESKAAKADWLNYGGFHFNTVYSNCDNRMLDHKDGFQKLGNRLNFAFLIATEKDLKQIVNLKDARHMFNSKPSVAYVFSKPKKVENQRRLIRLVQLGSRFVTIPQIVRGLFDRFTNSMYSGQVKTEGALLAYFESVGMMKDSKRVVRQSINPFL